MKVEHLEESILDYKESIESTINKKDLWITTTKPYLLRFLKSIVKRFEIGWKVQELNWLHNNEAVNITFTAMPPELTEYPNINPSYKFIPGGSLVFSQTYSGDIIIFIVYPDLNPEVTEDNVLDIALLSPEEITERKILENLDLFLKEMIKWEVPSKKHKVGFRQEDE